MKKTVFIFVILLLIMPSFTVFAEEEIIDKSLSLSGIEELIDILPYESQDYFKDGFDSESLDKITLKSVFSYILNGVKNNLLKPFKMFLSITGIMLISSAVFALKDGENTAFRTVVSLSVIAVLSNSVVECITGVTGSIKDMSYFLVSFVPVFSGVYAASGKVVSSFVYQTTVFGAIELFSQGIIHIVIPFLGIFLAISIVGSSMGVIKTDNLTKALKSVATWVLTFTMTIFVGLLTVKGIVSTSADTVTTKATKFVISSFIPVIGGALSEAYSSLSGCMGVVRSTVGAFGIVAIIVGYLPLIIKIVLMMASVSLCKMTGELLGREEETGVLKSVSSVVSVLFSITLCYGVMIIISVAIILMLGNGG